MNKNNETEKNNETNFNIYYMNISKVYEIKMMIDNIIPAYYEKERVYEKSLNFGSNTSLAKNVNFGIENSNKETVKLNEFLEVKNTKSIYLKEIISNCHSVKSIKESNEGDLIKIDEISLEFLDELNQRIISFLKKDIFEGMKVNEVNVNNLFTSILDDYPYFLKGCLNNNKENDNKNILIKIPMENKSGFESNYTVNDLLIGNVSIVGIYKGEVSEEDIKITGLILMKMIRDLFLHAQFIILMKLKI
ncbi:MAG: conserved hypothetical protein [Methanobrevibacter sp. CfCl-M3]